MATKKRLPIPIEMDEIVAGRRYITVGVDAFRHMSIEYFVFHESPVKKRDGWWIRVNKKQLGLPKSDDFLLNFQSVSDLGMGKKKTNDHRTFRRTLKNQKFLSTLVRNQSLRKYLKTIGVKYCQSKYEQFSMGY